MERSQAAARLPRIDYTELAELVKVVEAKRPWPYGKLADRRELGEARPARQYVAGEGFPYLGRSYRLRIVEPGREVRLLRGRLELGRGGGARDLVRWYRRVGESWLKRRTRPWAQRMGVEVTGLRCRERLRRLGPDLWLPEEGR
ncbi:YgjP-like metallopeptidase domain-containing protein [Microbispora sp. H10836]|uniref:YgjP-like metallopeptidase domain-containing protein n=1 Tax=Microbispora sp. H10836 TaxID=2729106 RepID=UPI001475BCCB|nr:YgjP-like metallopeptidase domain-containing protein [Microbispora sp. H10836]